MIVDLKNCTLFLIDGTGANFVGIRIGEGNFTYVNKRNLERQKSRGLLNAVREGEEQEVQITFQFIWEEFISSEGDAPTLDEIFNGQAAGWTSATFNDPYSPFSVHLQIVNTWTCYSPVGTPHANVHTLNFADFFYEELNHSLKDATVDCSGFSNRSKPTALKV